MENKNDTGFIRRLVSAVIATLLAIGGVAMSVTPALAYDTTCGAYGESPSFNCVAYSGYNGQQPWGYPVDAHGHNCTNYVSYRLWKNNVSNPGNLGNANSWDNNAAVYGITVNTSPAVGSIATWESYSGPAGPTGHVAYVEAVTSSYVDISEDNYGGTTMLKRFYLGQADAPDHYIHFVDVSGSVKNIAYELTSDGISHVFTGASSGVYETYWGPGVSGKVTQTLATDSNVTAIFSRITSDGIRHVFFATSSGVIREIYWGPGVSGKVTQTAGNVGSSVIDLSHQVTTDGIQHVYAATSSGITEIYWGPGVSGFQSGTLNSVSGITAISSELTSNGIQHVFAGLSNGQLRETYWGPGVSGKVTQTLVTLSSGVIDIASRYTSDGIARVYAGIGNKITETYWGPGVSGKVTQTLATF